MSNAIRHSPEDIRLWQHEGFAIMPAFFSREEIEPIFADYEQVYGEPHRNATDGESTRKTLKTPLGKFNNDQFRNMDTFPYEGSPELMMLSLHPALIAFARDALHTPLPAGSCKIAKRRLCGFARQSIRYNPI